MPAKQSRSESKELTRKALLRAALKLLSRNSYDSISLREVTREAGITPTAFYRHFDDMDELGLVLVDEAFGMLSTMLRDARSDPRLTDDAITRSVEIVADHLDRHEAHMRFISRERYGGVRRLRLAIRRELQLFADELAVDLSAFPMVNGWPADERRMLASLIAETMVHMVSELLDASDAERPVLIDRTTRQIRLIALGSISYRVPPSS